MGLSQDTKGRYQDLLAEARFHGVGTDFEAGFRRLEAELRAGREPGEQNYWLPTERPVYHAVFGPLSAHYAKYAGERIVWVFRLDLTRPGSAKADNQP